MQLPYLGHLTALTELQLVGMACLPPHWQGLAGLQRLRLSHRGLPGWTDWGSEALDGLQALARVELDMASKDPPGGGL